MSVTRTGYLILIILALPQETPAPRLDFHGDPLPEGAIARCGTILLKPDSAAGAFAFSPDGQRLLAWAGPLGTPPEKPVLHLYDASTGKTIETLRRVVAARAAAFSEEGNRVFWVDYQGVLWHWTPATGEEERMGEEIGETSGPVDITPQGLVVWPGLRRGRGWSISLADSRTGRILPSLRGPDRRIFHLRISRNGRRVIAGVTGGGLTAWDVESGDLLWKARSRRIAALGISSDGGLVAVASSVMGEKSRVEIRDGETGESIREFPSSLETFHTLHFDPEGAILVATGPAGFAAWDVSTGKAMYTHDSPTGVGPGLAFSPDGKRMALATTKRIRIVEAATGKTLLPTEGHQVPAGCLSFSPDGKTLASSSTDGTVRLWEAATGRPLHCMDWPRVSPVALFFTPDGSRLIGCRTETRIWDVETGRPTPPIPGVPLFLADVLPEDLSSGGLTTFAVSPDGKEMAVGHRDGWIRFHAEGEQRRESHMHEGIVLGLLYSPDGTSLTSIGDDDRCVRMDTRSGSRTWEMEIHGACAEGLAGFDETARHLAYADRDQRVHVWDLQEEKEVAELPGPPGRIQHLRFLDSARRLRVGGREENTIWDLSAENPWTSPSTLGPVRMPSRDKRLAVIADNGDNVRIRDRISGEVLDIPAFRLLFSRTETFSPDGRVLATSNTDATILLWDLETCLQESADLKAETLDQLWDRLSGSGAAAGVLAAWKMADAGDEAVTFIADRLKPSPDSIPETITRLIDDLGHDDFTRREEASSLLAGMGDDATAGLRQALVDGVDPERKIRIEALLKGMGKSDALVQKIRAIHVLEMIRGEKAKTVLWRLARGHPMADETRAAQVALVGLAAQEQEKQPTDEELATALVSHARDLVMKGEHEKALAQYREALKLKPDWTEVRMDFGRLGFEKGKTHLFNAIALEQSGEKDDAKRAKVEQEKADDLLAEAMETFHRVLAGDPTPEQKLNSLLYRGHIHAFFRRWDAARAEYIRAKECGPKGEALKKIEEAITLVEGEMEKAKKKE